MSKMKIAAPPANVNPAQTPLPQSGVKSAGKRSSGQPSDSPSDAQDFEAKLKEGLAEASKKDEAKKVVAAPAGKVQNSQAADMAKIAKLLEDEKATSVSGDGVDAKKKEGAQAKMGAELLSLGADGKTLISGLDAQSTDESPKFTAAKKMDPVATQLKDQAQDEASAFLKKSLTPLTGAMSKLDLTQLQSVQGQAVQEAKAQFDTDFDIESLEVKPGDPGALSAASSELASEKNANAVASSKLSTSDYLNLRDLGKKETPVSTGTAALGVGTGLGGKKSKLDLISSRDGLGAQSSQAVLHPNQTNLKTIDATVTQGAGGKTILSHDSVNQLTTTVNMMSLAKQDGEIKIRLRPDHLGELAMTVKTMGNQVSIQIKAQDGEAKRIIEESLGSLKDSFAKQNLNLAQIDVVTAPNQTQTQDQGMQMNFADSRQNFGQESRGFDQGQNTRQEARYEESFNSSNLNVSPARTSRYASNQGLDLIA